MDAVTYIEKIAKLNDGSFGAMIASDIMSAVNTKLAALNKEAAPRPTNDYLSLMSSVTGKQKELMSRRLLMARKYIDAAPKLDLNSAQLKFMPKPTTAPTFSGQMMGPEVAAGFGPNRPQIRQQIFNKEVGK